MGLQGTMPTLGLSCDTAPIARPVYPRGQVVHNLMSTCPKTDSRAKPSALQQRQALSRATNQAENYTAMQKSHGKWH